MASSSFGGTIKLTGESEYRNALRNITSELKSVGSQLKLATTEFENNGYKVNDLRTKNESLKNKLNEEQEIVKICSNALKDFTDQQTKNKSEIDKLTNSINDEKQKLDIMKNSTNASNNEIEKQEKIISELEKELIKSQTAYDSNNRKINDYNTQMNNAKVECSNLTSEIKNNQSILDKYGNSAKSSSQTVKEFSNEEEKAGQSTLKLGDLIKANLISDGIIAGIKGMVSAVKSIASGLLDVGKSAVQSYADYEQLIGGVETLFKESNSLVQEYAQNAYKTAGLSANEYMETVTSFSASLLQSLNGDTAKSAEVADMAITDMADNANKMGTSMESIQNAYQGFAKQNYTMLDNLKLGYGGTKSEMERLLTDAQAISGIEYDISNLNDVYSAIHVIQGELGITGTTAKEASTTISGSVSSMKSAWENFITGLADQNSNLDELISNLVDSALTVADNLMPVIETILNSIVEILPEIINKIVEYLPNFLEIGSNLLTSLITGISENLPQIMTTFLEIINILNNTIIENLPQILQMGIQMIVSLIQGIANQLPTLIPTILDALILMTTTLLDNIDLIIDSGIQLIIGLAQGLINALPQLIEKIPVIIDKLIMAITDNLPKIIEMGIELTIQLAVGIIKAIPDLLASIPKIISSLLNGIANYYSQITSKGKELLGKIKDGIMDGISKIPEVGKNLVQGLWNGINDAKDWVIGKIKGFGESILNGIKSFFGINSPSKVFKEQIGTNLALGIGEGFSDTMSNISEDMANSIPTDFYTTINPSVNASSFGYSNFDDIVEAFKIALRDVKVIMNDREFGTFVKDTVEEVVYS